MSNSHSIVRELIAEIHDPYTGTRELAVALCERLGDEERTYLMIQGAQDAILAYETSLRNTAKRTGHLNASGRWRGAALLEGRGILGLPVRLDDGRSFTLGDMDREVLADVVADYQARIDRNMVERDRYQRIHDELARDGLDHVRDLGEERVEALWHG